MLTYLTSVSKSPIASASGGQAPPSDKIYNILTQAPRVAVFSGDSGKGDISYVCGNMMCVCWIKTYIPNM